MLRNAQDIAKQIKLLVDGQENAQETCSWPDWYAGSRYALETYSDGEGWRTGHVRWWPAGPLSGSHTILHSSPDHTFASVSSTLGTPDKEKYRAKPSRDVSHGKGISLWGSLSLSEAVLHIWKCGQTEVKVPSDLGLAALALLAMAIIWTLAFDNE